MLKLTRGIQRVNVYDDHPGTENANRATGYCSKLGIINATRSPFFSPRPLLQNKRQTPTAFLQLAKVVFLHIHKAG
ncbi:hypothetical protein ACNKHT_09045 [Shigella flexneri]